MAANVNSNASRATEALEKRSNKYDHKAAALNATPITDVKVSEGRNSGESDEIILTWHA